MERHIERDHLMGKNVAALFQECIKAGKIKTSTGLNELADKELRVAEGDLEVARIFVPERLQGKKSLLSKSGR